MKTRPKYVCYSFVYDFEDGLRKEQYSREYSNNLEYFDKYKNKENFRIVIKEGNKVIYSEIEDEV